MQLCTFEGVAFVYDSEGTSCSAGSSFVRQNRIEVFVIKRRGVETNRAVQLEEGVLIWKRGWFLRTSSAKNTSKERQLAGCCRCLDWAGLLRYRTNRCEDTRRTRRRFNGGGGQEPCHRPPLIKKCAFRVGHKDNFIKH